MQNGLHEIQGYLYRKGLKNYISMGFGIIVIILSHQSGSGSNNDGTNRMKCICLFISTFIIYVSFGRMDRKLNVSTKRHSPF